MQIGTTEDHSLYNKSSAAVRPGALAAGSLPQCNIVSVDYYGFLQPLQASSGIGIRLTQDSVVLNPFQSIIVIRFSICRWKVGDTVRDVEKPTDKGTVLFTLYTLW